MIRFSTGLSGIYSVAIKCCVVAAMIVFFNAFLSDGVRYQSDQALSVYIRLTLRFDLG